MSVNTHDAERGKLSMLATGSTVVRLTHRCYSDWNTAELLVSSVCRASAPHAGRREFESHHASSSSLHLLL